MPATAGRVRMPANNRGHSSAALQTHGIWQSVIGYDPYAPQNNKHQAPSASANAATAAANEASSSEPAASSVNASTSLQSLLDLARLTSNPDETRGACKKCRRIGHLTFQCRNFLSVKIGMQDDILLASNEPEAQAKFAETKNKVSDADDEGSEEEDIDNDSSVSDIDPMLEKIIAERQRVKSRRGKQSEENDKKTSRHRSSNSKDKKKYRRKNHESSDQDSESDSDMKRHGKDRKRRRTHRRKDDPSDDDQSGGGGRRHRHHKRRHHGRVAPHGDRVHI